MSIILRSGNRWPWESHERPNVDNAYSKTLANFHGALARASQTYAKGGELFQQLDAY